MNFSLSKPDFAKYFTSETKYSIAITADDSIKKVCKVHLEWILCFKWWSAGVNNHGCRTSVIMTLWHTHTLIHDITTKYPKPTELTTWLVIQKL
jgi:hypothetical protein